MVFLDEVTEQAARVARGRGAVMHAGEACQFGLEFVPPTGGTVEIDQGIADHQLVAGRAARRADLEVDALAGRRVAAGSGEERGEPEPRLDVARERHQVGALIGGVPGPVHDRVGVGRDAADGGVDLIQREAKLRHGSSVEE